ncbi:MAG TPA: EAL domain-containing protein [Candidatus Baltobacteraceae bacterium]|jgi:diguanylate cyclase (GGDEF)-like protein|nr:EAL domain-containing protein [Candidatus Baltobacteraceae bacterium]
MGSETQSARSYRPPWFWLPILGIAALLVTFMIANNARTRVEQNEREFRSGQEVRLHEIETNVDDYFGKAIQLAETGAQTLAAVNDDPARVSTLVAELFRSRSTPQVYGVGVYYAPGVFKTNNSDGLFSIYYAAPEGKATEYHHDVSVVPPYTAYDWYERAVKTPEQVRFAGPYWEGSHSYISTVRALRRNGKTVGVMAVDTLTQTFRRQNMARLLAPGDIAWIESSIGHGTLLVTTAPLPKDGDWRNAAIVLRYTGAHIHLTSSAIALHTANARIVTISIVLAVAIWFFAGVLGASSIQIWRSRRRAFTLESERTRLENEIAVGKRVESELRKAAYTDALTGLPNRAAFMENTSEAIVEAQRGVRYAVFFIDLDRFNMINETLGHPFGDELLKSIASRLHDQLEPRATVSRLGGDEFLVLAPVDDSQIGVVAQRILEIIHEPMLLGGRLLYSGASVGVVAVDSEYHRPEELLRDADIAMYEAKSRGRGCYAVFDTAMRTRVAAESDLENDLRRAIERHEFVPYYQPIFDVRTNTVVGFEALVRWRRPGSGVVGAAEFIAYAERRGLVDAIDTSVLEDVCRDSAAIFEPFPSAGVAVNVSAVHLTAPDLAANVDSALRAYSMRPERLKLEITETAIMRNPDVARATLRALQGNGVTIVLDDFGAGHSSLAYLHRLPIEGVKIDQSFIAPLTTDRSAVAIVRSIVALAKTLELYTVAEGVETAEQLEIVRQLGVDHAQGYFFSPPVPLGSIAASASRTTV